MREPKFCPFCESDDVELYEHCVYAQVRCRTCGARGPEERRDAAAAIDKWNAAPRPEKKGTRHPRGRE